jgi:hypothetical protein
MLGYNRALSAPNRALLSRSDKVYFYGFFRLFERFTVLFRIFTPFQKMSGCRKEKN